MSFVNDAPLEVYIFKRTVNIHKATFTNCSFLMDAFETGFREENHIIK